MNVCYIISDIQKALAFEWIAASLPTAGWSISFILLNPGESDLEKHLQEKNFLVVRVKCSGKKDWPAAIWKVSRQLRIWKPDIVHCHLIQGTLIGLTSARLAGIRHRIYTRHHSSLHHVYFRKGIMWDKLSNRLATRIVAISGVVRHILTEWERVPAEKVTLIPHGFRMNDFTPRLGESDKWKVKYWLETKAPVIGVVARFTEWKGIQYTIQAFRKFIEKVPGAVLLLFNPEGDYANSLHRALDELPRDSYQIIEFEADMSSVYGAMDFFIHVPVDEHSEAFGQIYVEALAAGVPSIFTLSGIAPEFIRHEENALVVPFRDSDAIYEAMVRLWENTGLRDRLSANGPASVKEKFDLPIMIHALDNLYRQCLTR